MTSPPISLDELMARAAELYPRLRPWIGDRPRKCCGLARLMRAWGRLRCPRAHDTHDAVDLPYIRTEVNLSFPHESEAAPFLKELLAVYGVEVSLEEMQKLARKVIRYNDGGTYKTPEGTYSVHANPDRGWRVLCNSLKRYVLAA